MRCRLLLIAMAATVLVAGASCTQVTSGALQMAPPPGATSPAGSPSVAPPSAPAMTSGTAEQPAAAPSSPVQGPDSLYPAVGNVGIDVRHYDLDVAFDQPTTRLSGSVTITLVVTSAATEIVLDCDGPSITTVTVDGRPAAFTTGGGNVRITSPSPLAAGASAVVRIDYTLDTSAVAARPGVGPQSPGWFNTPTGSYVLNEPDGAHSWLPSNDHPADKATWTFRVTVGPGRAAVANGLLRDHVTTDAGEVWTWDEDHPMATYLVQLLTGDYQVIDAGTTPAGVRLVHAVVKGSTADMATCTTVTTEQLAFFTDVFGPYPFASYGLALTESFPGLAMETQGRSTFSALDTSSCTASTGVLAHELAHQWVGDAVTPADWGDIWLNESFATYAQWMWMERAGLATVDGLADNGLRTRTATPTGTPTAAEMFGVNSYDGGAVVLHALRRTIGEQPFRTLLRRWVEDNRYTSRRTADFIALAEQVSGRQLDELFDQWLFSSTVPDRFPDVAA